jgi:hypothetical protein
MCVCGVAEDQMGRRAPEGPGFPLGTSGEDTHFRCPLVLVVHSARCRTIDSKQSQT